jgi:hypothetical protein
MAVTVTYLAPPAVAGGTIAPTAAQSFRYNSVIADIIKSADGDAAAVVTHNWGLSAAQLAAGGPWIMLIPLLPEFYITEPYVAAADITTNAVTITLGTGTGSGAATAQIRVVLIKPPSIIK